MRHYRQKRRLKFIFIIIFIVLIFTILNITKSRVETANIPKNTYAVKKAIHFNTLNEETLSFENCDYEYTVSGNIKLREYLGDADSIIVPNEIDGHIVESIAFDIFDMSDYIEMVKIPQNIANNISELSNFEKNSELSDTNYVVYTTTKEYNELYLKYIEKTDEEKSQIAVIPDKFVKLLQKEEPRRIIYASSENEGKSEMPRSYRIEGLDVEDQGDTGICYAYAAITCAESNLLKTKNLKKDFSERHLALVSKQGSGGGFDKSNSDYFRKAYGPLEEDVYAADAQRNNYDLQKIERYCENDSTLSSSELKTIVNNVINNGTEPQYYVLIAKYFDYIYGNMKEDSSYTTTIQNYRNETIKPHIKNNGSICAWIPYNYNYVRIYNNKTVMCIPSELSQAEIDAGAHLVSIVGWDDDFSASNFPSEWGVTSNGAYLVLNSWGSSWGDGGYFWVSYEDYYIECCMHGVTAVSVGKTDISETTINVDLSSKSYTGTEIKPELTVYYLGSKFRLGTDYTVTYSNNINAGTAKITVTGMGRFTGSVEKEFTINPISLENAIATLDNTVFDYNGSEKKPNASVTLNGTDLRYLIDYDIVYSNNINAGIANANVVGINNYSGEIVNTFTIQPKTITITSGNNEKVYDGQKLVQEEASITDGSLVTGHSINIITNGEITDVGESQNTISSVTITQGEDEVTRNYEITQEYGTLKVTKRELTVTANSTSIEKGASIPEFTYTYANNVNGEIPGFEGSLQNDGGTDLEIGEYDILIGTLALKDNGVFKKDNYEISFVSAKLEVKKSKISIGSLNIELSQNSYTYDGTEKKPSISFTDNLELVENTDFTISYSNNLNAGTATVKITGNNDYSGETTKEFTIGKRDLNVIAGDIQMTYGSDIPTLTYTYNNNVNGEIPEFEGSLAVDGSANLSAGTHNIVIGTLVLKDKGNFKKDNYRLNFTGNTVTVAKKNVSSQMINLPEGTYVYDNTFKEPIITVTSGTITLVKDTDYEVEYLNNKNAGNAKVKITGIGNYDGTAEKEFTIDKAMPEYNNPTGLKIIEGSTLADVILPEGFMWELSPSTSVGSAGRNRFNCVFIPDDTDNYNIVTNIEVEIIVYSAQNDLIEVDDYDYKTKNNEYYIDRIIAGRDLTSLSEKIHCSDNEVRVYDNNVLIPEEEYDNYVAKTGMKVEIDLPSGTRAINLVVSGDISGDGLIDGRDLLRLARYLADLDSDMSEIELMAADTCITGANANLISGADLLKLARVMAGLESM